VVQNFDELNRALPYETYFGEMEITQLQKDIRITLANKLESVVFFMYDLIAVYIDAEFIDMQVITQKVVAEYIKAIQEYVVIDDYITSYVDNVVTEIVDTTIQHITEAYYTSIDRAKVIAENEANSLMNYEEMEEARISGKTKKTWKTLKDKRVRHTHEEVDEETLSIDRPFIVGTSLMMFPRDKSLYASDKEIINCRCSIKYS